LIKVNTGTTTYRLYGRTINTHASSAGDRQFEFQDSQILHSTNGSPPLQHLSKYSLQLCYFGGMSRRWGSQTRVVTHFCVIRRV